MDSQRFNLTRGEIPGKLLLVSLPIIGTQLMLMGYNLVDMFLLGRVGADAVASSGAAGMYMWLAGGLMLVGRIGAEIGVSQAKGKGDTVLALDYSHNSLLLAIVLGGITTAVFMAYPGQLIGFLYIQDPGVAADAREYLFIIGLGEVAVFISAAIGGTFTGAGNSRVPFLLNGIGLAMNAILDPIFIFTLGMGVKGAAIATVIAQVIGGLLSLYWLLVRKDRPFPHYAIHAKPVADCIRQILRWAVPVSVENMLFSWFAMVVTREIAEYGSTALTVARIGSMIESLCWLVCLGFSSGITAFVGQNFGAGKWFRIRSGIRISLAILIPWGLALTVLFMLAGGPLTGIFVPEQRVIDLGRDYLWYLSFCQVFFCLESVGAGALRGMGRTLPPSISSIVMNGLRIPTVYLLSQTSLGLDGIWLGVSLTAALRGMLVFSWFLHDAGKRPHHDTTSRRLSALE